MITPGAATCDHGFVQLRRKDAECTAAREAFIKAHSVKHSELFQVRQGMGSPAVLLGYA
ncbi:MAG TPA: hypothetical protein VHJ19_06550 [Gammaproteobacteria bacterium]|nr:hypothetical protein [Gammaproteobacteria bacterium]